MRDGLFYTYEYHRYDTIDNINLYTSVWKDQPLRFQCNTIYYSECDKLNTGIVFNAMNTTHSHV